jgi:hypothetical protein
VKNGIEDLSYNWNPTYNRLDYLKEAVDQLSLRTIPTLRFSSVKIRTGIALYERRQPSIARAWLAEIAGSVTNFAPTI